jgi:hypothetical protein
MGAADELLAAAAECARRLGQLCAAIAEAVLRAADVIGRALAAWCAEWDAMLAEARRFYGPAWPAVVANPSLGPSLALAIIDARERMLDRVAAAQLAELLADLEPPGG